MLSICRCIGSGTQEPLSVAALLLVIHKESDAVFFRVPGRQAVPVLGPDAELAASIKGIIRDELHI